MTETGRCCWQLLIQGWARGRQNISDSGSVVCGNFYFKFVTKETGVVVVVGGGCNCVVWLPKMILHIIDTNDVENEMKGILIPQISDVCAAPSGA